MTQYSKFNIVYRLQKWIDSVPGQTFLNYAYSWGASIVILGTLFKLTHLPGANVMLYLGMGTEVLVFFISAFDRPFDKTAIGMDLPVHLEDEESEEGRVKSEESALGGSQTGGQTVIVGNLGGVGALGSVGALGGVGISGDQEIPAAPAGSVATVGTVASTLNTAPIADGMQEATENYVEELKTLTETLQKVSEQSRRLTKDSEEMENLNRTLTGICKIYEMQLKSASSQIGTIDEINGQTRKLADQITELNKIYTRMIEAMTVNMRAAGGNPVA